MCHAGWRRSEMGRHPVKTALWASGISPLIGGQMAKLYIGDVVMDISKLTLTPEVVAKIVAAEVAKALAAQQADRQETAVKAAKDGKSERSIQNEVLAVRAFKKAGFKDAVPHKTVMTYNRWLANGRKVREGEKSIKVKNLRLFHISQTDVISAAEKADAAKSMQDAIAAHNAKRKADATTSA